MAAYLQQAGDALLLSNGERKSWEAVPGMNLHSASSSRKHFVDVEPLGLLSTNTSPGAFPLTHLESSLSKAPIGSRCCRRFTVMSHA